MSKADNLGKIAAEISLAARSAFDNESSIFLVFLQVAHRHFFSYVTHTLRVSKRGIVDKSGIDIKQIVFNLFE